VSNVRQKNEARLSFCMLATLFCKFPLRLRLVLPENRLHGQIYLPNKVFRNAVYDGIWLVAAARSFEEFPDLDTKGCGEVAERPSLGIIVAAFNVGKKGYGDVGFFGKIGL